MQERRKDSNDQTFQLFCEKFDAHNQQITRLFAKIDAITDHCAERGQCIAEMRKDINAIGKAVSEHALILVGPDGQSGLSGMMKSIVTSFRVIKVLFAGLIMSLPVITIASKAIKHFVK